MGAILAIAVVMRVQIVEATSPGSRVWVVVDVVRMEIQHLEEQAELITKHSLRGVIEL